MADLLAPGPHMTLYHTASARSIRALWTLHEMGIADKCKLVTMPFPPRVFVKEYLKINVLGTIPFFVDDGGKVKMTESCAIPKYLVEKYGPSPLEVKPSEPDFAAYLNWIAHADATLTFPQTVVLRYTRQEPGRADAAAEDYGKWYIARLRLLDSVLEDGREFLCSGRFTIADICVVFALMLGVGFEFDKKYKPQTLAYMKRILERPAFKAAAKQETQSALDFQAAAKAAKAKL
eukprot:gnl/TRDRNA2_/TRDRNA2_81197_c0_seq1.p1 gnl/TRDRNA2_/TRDRNA2_81197_c0~~gnl/TRDRNA2_/TRDRNA2_81197_c0_seq1.p1  ORF type:complete len:234 (-),score=52.92 gnl/TRDRNA2_/TRDRNA2_81197_c0_seq1:152-853(-)